MKVGEIWIPKFYIDHDTTREDTESCKVVIIRLETGTVMSGPGEEYNPNIEYVCYKFLNSGLESGLVRQEFVKLYERTYP